MKTSLQFRTITPDDSQWIKELCEKDWGGEPLVVRAKKFYPSQMQGIIAAINNKTVGVLFYEMRATECEIIMFEVFDKLKGIGTKMLEEIIKLARSHHCKRLYLMTTNDNLDALRFYQRRGFTICGIHLDSVKHSRSLKPSIGLVGDHGIPLRDEIDMEFVL